MRLARSLLSTLRPPQKLTKGALADILELALLILFRHVSFYLDADRTSETGASSRPDVGLGLAGSLKARKDPALALSVSQFDLPSLREDLADEFSKLSERLTGLQFVRRSPCLVPRPTSHLLTLLSLSRSRRRTPGRVGGSARRSSA